MREHLAYLLLTNREIGTLEDARDYLEDVYEAYEQNPGSQQLLCQMMTTLAEIHRRLGDTEQAQRLVEKAAAEQSRHELRGDLAAYSLACMAKLQTNLSSSQSILCQAEAIQTELQDRVGEARTLLLQARLHENARSLIPTKSRLLELASDISALRQCRLLARVLERWDQWASGELAPDETGDIFWGV